LSDYITKCGRSEIIILLLFFIIFIYENLQHYIFIKNNKNKSYLNNLNISLFIKSSPFITWYVKSSKTYKYYLF